MSSVTLHHWCDSCASLDLGKNAMWNHCWRFSLEQSAGLVPPGLLRVLSYSRSVHLLAFNHTPLTSRSQAPLKDLTLRRVFLPKGFGKPVQIFFKWATLRCFRCGYWSAAPSLPPPHPSSHVWHLFLPFIPSSSFRKTVGVKMSVGFIFFISFSLMEVFYTRRTKAQYEAWAAVSQRQ